METVIETKDYGLIAFCIYKYDAERTSTGVNIKTELSKVEILKAYNTSEFVVYNTILRDVVKKG